MLILTQHAFTYNANVHAEHVVQSTLDRNDLKLGTVVLLNSPPKPIDFAPNRFRGTGAGGNEIWDPLNISVSDEATFFKFGVHVDSGLFLPADHKLAPKWAWPGVRAQF